MSGVNREYKDRLFVAIFGRRENQKWTLSLYNAVNGTSYEDPSEIEINTMDDSVYMGMKNDVSFILRDHISIYEQQSTYNPNMPLREMIYLGRLYGKYVKKQEKDIYGKTLITLPVPKLVVFYNGTDDQQDQVLRLSDAFPDNLKKESDVEVQVRMININYGHNRELMKKCKPLAEYAWFIDTVRKNMKEMGNEVAVDKAIDEMPRDYEIRKFLEGNREEVRMDLITEYDAEEHMRLVRRDAQNEGLEKGIRLFIEDKIEDGFSSEQIREKLRKKFLLSEDLIEEYMKKYAGPMVTS